MLAPTPRILALSPPAAVRAPRISVAKRIVGAELSLSFPLPRRTAPFLLPRIALYPQSAWWRACGGLLGGGGCAVLGTVVCDALMRHCLSDEFEVQHECKLQCPHTFIEVILLLCFVSMDGNNDSFFFRTSRDDPPQNGTFTTSASRPGRLGAAEGGPSGGQT